VAELKILLNTVVRRMLGDGYVSAVEIENTKTGEHKTPRPSLQSFLW
jgi:hypothetical protein